MLTTNDKRKTSFLEEILAMEGIFLKKGVSGNVSIHM